nr:hypothetical protein [Tanacetum cinerariifolium]
MPASPVNDRYQSREGYRVVPPPYTRTFMPPKPDLVFHDAPTMHETVPTAFNVELSPTKPNKDLSHRPSTSIIENWVTDSEDESEAEPLQNDPRVLTRSKLVPLTAARPVTTAVPHNNVTRPRPANHVGTKPHLPPRRTINRRPPPPASNFPLKVTTVKTPKVNVVKGVQGNWINDGYVAFGGNQKGGKITGKGKIRTDTECIILSHKFKLPDENQVLLRVPRENNMYNVGSKNIVPSGYLTCLFANVTPPKWVVAK